VLDRAHKLLVQFLAPNLLQINLVQLRTSSFFKIYLNTPHFPSHTTFLHIVPRLIYYLGLGKCWEIPGKCDLKGFYTLSLVTVWTNVVWFRSDLLPSEF
jgi:hypothetical protein